MKEKTAVETLIYLIDLLVSYLEDFKNRNNLCNNEFILGERTAYVECLEILQMWKDAFKNGLNFDIEKRFPI